MHIQPGKVIGRRQQAVELGVVLLLVVPSIAISSSAVSALDVGFSTVAVSVIFHDLALLALVIYLVWRNGESLHALGLKRGGAAREAVLGVILYLPFVAAAAALQRLLADLGLSSPGPPQVLEAIGPAQAPLAALLTVVVAVSEETVFRGYLILRLRALSGSPALAVLLSAAVFSLGHGYEGVAGMITVGAMGAAFGVIYLLRSNLVAPMVMHFLQDFIQLVVVPLGGAGAGR